MLKLVKLPKEFPFTPTVLVLPDTLAKIAHVFAAVIGTIQEMVAVYSPAALAQA